MTPVDTLTCSLGADKTNIESNIVDREDPHVQACEDCD